MKKNWFLLNLLALTAVCAHAQEINFSRVQDMAIWYNQSLKTNKQSSLKLNYRNVQFGGLIAYNSTSVLFDMPLLPAEKRGSSNTGGYFSMSAGAASDKSNQGILNNTIGMLGISYAIPIAPNSTYIALGFQGSYYRSQLNVANIDGAFADQYDAYGVIPGAQSADQMAAGWSYGYMNTNAGISMFSDSKYNKWYVGASAMHFNRPFTDHNKTADYRLAIGWGVQGGYRFITPTDDEVAFYMSLNWQGKAYKHYFNGIFVKSLKSLPGAGIGFGLGYRYDDALVPTIDLRYQLLTLGFSYDVNISDINAAGIKRNGLELGVKIDF